MTLKLSADEFNALLRHVKDTVEQWPDAANFKVKLQGMLIVEVYLKFYSHAIAKSKYTVTLKPYEAVNWFNVFSTHHFEVTSYRGNL